MNFFEGLRFTERINTLLQSAILLIGIPSVCWFITWISKLVLRKMPYPLSKILDY